MTPFSLFSVSLGWFSHSGRFSFTSPSTPPFTSTSVYYLPFTVYLLCLRFSGFCFAAASNSRLIMGTATEQLLSTDATVAFFSLLFLGIPTSLFSATSCHSFCHRTGWVGNLLVVGLEGVSWARCSVIFCSL